MYFLVCIVNKSPKVSSCDPVVRPTCHNREADIRTSGDGEIGWVVAFSFQDKQSRSLTQAMVRESCARGCWWCLMQIIDATCDLFLVHVLLACCVVLSLPLDGAKVSGELVGVWPWMSCGLCSGALHMN